MSIVASDPVIAGPPQGDAGPFCGISEYVVNELRKEVFIRGYLAAEGSAVEPTVLLADGATLAASRSGIDRPDLGEFHGELAELPCGFEFTLPLSRTEGWPAGRVPICGQSRSGRPLRLLVQYAQRRLSAEVRIDGFEISLIENTLVIDGKFVGNVGIVPTTIRLNGIPLHAHMTTSGEPERENSTRPFSIRATGSTRIGLRNHQVFLGTGDVVEVDFCIGESAYRLNWHTKLEPRHMLPVVGAIHSLRYSPASHMLEVRGAFAGNFSSGQVKLVIAGKEQSRAAKIAAEPRLVTGPIGRLFDAPFGEWIWCDQFDLPSSSRTRLTVELRDGPRVLGHTHTTLSAGSVEQVTEALEPSYFESPLQPLFDRLTATIETRNEDAPLVVLVFQGDLFQTFAGGSARVQEMARFLTRMGFSVGLIDLASDGEAGATVPDSAADLFRFRIGLPRDALDTMVMLALDYNSRHGGFDGCRVALQAAINPPERDQSQLIARRTKVDFNALAAFFCALARPDFVIASFAWTAGIFESLPGEVCKILDLHDIQFLRGQSLASSIGDQAYHSDLAGEVAAWQKADLVLAIQGEDKAFVLEHSPKSHVVLCSHALPIDRRPSPGSGNHVVLFVGNRYPPNTEGIRAFLARNWPQIRRRVPDATLRVVGTVCEDLADMPDGVALLGVIPDIRDAYDAASVVINPVEFGSGLNIKTVEALCFGKCVVSTPFGLRGIVADDTVARPAEGAKLHLAVIDLLRHPKKRQQMEAAAFEFAEAQLSPDTIFRELFNTMELRLYG